MEDSNSGFDCSRKNVPYLGDRRTLSSQTLRDFNQYNQSDFHGDSNPLPLDSSFNSHVVHKADSLNAHDNPLAPNEWWPQPHIHSQSSSLPPAAQLSLMDMEPDMAATDTQRDITQLRYDQNDPSLGVLRLQETKSKSYKCSEAACNNRQLADKAGFKRHMREVHGSELYRCPITTCNRHTNGFARRWNLTQHQNRRHRQRRISLKHRSNDLMSAESFSSSSLPSHPHDVPQELDQNLPSPSEPASASETEVATESVLMGDDIGAQSYTQGDSQGRFSNEIQHLKRRKADSIRDFDIMIAALERAQKRRAEEAM